MSIQDADTARTWIFQANPDKYSIFESLKNTTEELWNLNQHANSVHAGDRVLIWISGEHAGIYALGTVLTEPLVQSDSPEGIRYWKLRGEGKRPKPRVVVRYDRIFLEKPLSKRFLEADPDLWSLRILQFPRATNFPVTQREWLYIREYLDTTNTV